jgi:hypothetical protein
VDVAPDLGHATVWVSVIGDEATRRTSLRALGRAMPFVRHRLGDLRLKRIPELHLRHDDSAERGTRVLRLIDELTDAESGPPDPVAPLESLPAPRTPRGVPEPPDPSRRRGRGRRSPAGQRAERRR